MEPLDLWEEITDRLGDAEALLVVGNVAFGVENLSGLRLVANCLCHAYAICDCACPPAGAPDKAAADHLAAVKGSLAALFKGCGLSCVLCYHVCGTAEWNLAHSQDLSLDRQAQAGPLRPGRHRPQRRGLIRNQGPAAGRHGVRAQRRGLPSLNRDSETVVPRAASRG
jgi:hypothetical protein